MAFNANEYKQALERPTYIDTDESGNEVIFTGDIVPFNTVAEFLPILSDLGNHTEDEILALVPQIVAAIKMPAEAVPYIQNLPITGVLECLASFFVSLKGVRKQ